jgi:transcription initiation factor TFIIH subunit 2
MVNAEKAANMPQQLPIPPYPVVFTKPPDAIAGPTDDIPIHQDAVSMLDYKGELGVVIRRDALNVSKDDALDYVLGYTCANDISTRNFQLPEVSRGQYCFAKSFDKFGPIRPCIVSPGLILDPQKLTLSTRVNGDTRQETLTSDMIFTVKQIIAHLSKGTTIRAGTVIMTGTPSGVGLFCEPQAFLKVGDEVEVEIDAIGVIQNRIVSA